MKKGIVVGVLAVVVLGISGAAFATDVKGITMVSVTAGQFTPGDTMGFPLTISKSGSYKLLENLTVPNANTTAILVTADNVTIDLNGFAILGPTVCTVDPVVCSPTGTGKGIDATGHINIKVYNGTVSGMGNDGISTGNDATIENVHVQSNGRYGLIVGGGPGNGIVRGNTATMNGNAGIATGGVVSGNTANGNHDAGIFCGSGCTVSGNTANDNGSDGISVSTGIANGNSAIYNHGYGLNFTSIYAGYVSNVLSNNIAGTVNGGTELGDNLCNGSTTCP